MSASTLSTNSGSGFGPKLSVHESHFPTANLNDRSTIPVVFCRPAQPQGQIPLAGVNVTACNQNGYITSAFTWTSTSGELITSWYDELEAHQLPTSFWDSKHAVALTDDFVFKDDEYMTTFTERFQQVAIHETSCTDTEISENGNTGLDLPTSTQQANSYSSPVRSNPRKRCANYHADRPLCNEDHDLPHLRGKKSRRRCDVENANRDDEPIWAGAASPSAEANNSGFNSDMADADVENNNEIDTTPALQDSIHSDTSQDIKMSDD